MIKNRLSDDVETSPASYKSGKRDLDTMVRELGLPSHFLTFTMNETGAMIVAHHRRYDCGGATGSQR